MTTIQIFATENGYVEINLERFHLELTLMNEMMEKKHPLYFPSIPLLLEFTNEVIKGTRDET